MRCPSILAGLVVGVCALSAAVAAELPKIKVLYLADVGTPRAKSFENFLQQHVGQVAVAPRDGFKRAEVENVDVVLLDWPQSSRTEDEWKERHSPLGPRNEWTKPTVLLGSAGLNLAVVWKVRAGSG